MFWRILKNNIVKYLVNLFVAIDQLFNTIFLGDPDETLSSRAGKKGGFWSKVIDKIFFWQDNHSFNSIEEDEGERTIR